MTFQKTLAAALALLAVSATHAADQTTTAQPAKPMTVSAGRLENIPIHAADDPHSLVIYVSDRAGWTATDDKNVNALQADGNVVLAIDFSRYAAKLDADDGECLYVVGELTDLSQTAERQLGIQSYLPPIIVGSGEGATFAYAALADAPANTLGGAVATGFANKLGLKLPFCPGATSTKTADGKAFAYGFDTPLPESAYLFTDPETVDAVSDLAAVQEDIITVDTVDDEDGPGQLVAAVAELAATDEPFGDLPAVDLPASGTPTALAVLVSGDGGWRDLDKTIGEWLSTKGVHVVGLDALHYFWSKRTPQELARDITTIVDSADPDKKLPVMLIGYSFGADTVPFAFPLLSPELQERTKVLALMAPGQTTSFQVTIEGWLDIDDSGYQIVPAIAALPADRVVCVYGEDEDDSSCPDPKLNKVTRVKTSGGHHFDGEYEALGQKFLDRLAVK
jgi:type IV secretory pathway VirJ component